MTIKGAGYLVIVKRNDKVRILRGFSAENGKSRSIVDERFGIQNGQREIIDHILRQDAVVVDITALLTGMLPIVFVIERVLKRDICFAAVKEHGAGRVVAQRERIVVGAVDLQFDSVGYFDGLREKRDRLRIKDTGIRFVRPVFKRNCAESEDYRILRARTDRKIIFDHVELIFQRLGGKRHGDRSGRDIAFEQRGVAAAGTLFDQLAVFVGAEIVIACVFRVIDVNPGKVCSAGNRGRQGAYRPRRKSSVKHRRLYVFYA